MVVCECGAAYEYSEVITFPLWRCYDCAREWLQNDLPQRLALLRG